MSLTPGTLLGPYEILSALGVGGMGEVYRARDRRLDRIVAIKVLSAEFSGREDLRQRFEREARAVSSLNHPHICTLYDIGHQDGIDYLVMEYLEGGTLASRLTRGSLPTDQVLRYAIEIADALDKAHRQGVVHRDLKPGNIMLTKSGAKLLDFGLAKILEKDSKVTGLSLLPTQEAGLTAEGTILGTLQYMAPEQLEGKISDARTDIFAFGAILYEMITGQKAFSAKSQASLIAAILEREPAAVTALQPMTPPALDRLIKTCLAKDPDDRWQTAHDMMIQLKWIAEGGSQAGVPTPIVSRRKNREKIAWALVSILLLAVVGLAITYFQNEPSEERLIRFFIAPPEKTKVEAVAVSPDGKTLAFAATDLMGKRLLWIRPLDRLQASALPGTEGATYPFWSPDSRFVGFFANGRLKKVDVAGGSPQNLCDTPEGRGGTWNRDGVILFARQNDRVYRISAAGGRITPITVLDQNRKESSHRWPYFLPDGRHFLYFSSISTRHPDNAVYLGSLDAKETKQLLQADSMVLYASPGYLLFTRGGALMAALMAQRFDPTRLQLEGEEVWIADSIEYDAISSFANFSVSDNGVLAYHTGSGSDRKLTEFDRSGKQIRIIGAVAEAITNLSLSPDEKRLAVSRLDPSSGNADIWMTEVRRGTSSRFTFEPSNQGMPLWSPDGSRIVYMDNQKGPENFYQRSSNRSGTAQVFYESEVAHKHPQDWSRDGRFILYHVSDPKTKGDLWVLPVSGERKGRPVVQSPSDETQGQFSPDGRWIAYTSNETGMWEIYVQPFSESGAKVQVSLNGGSHPQWRRDGKELFYLAPDKKLMVVEVKESSSSFEFGLPRPLFEVPVQLDALPLNAYRVMANGERFLVKTALEDTAAPVTVVVNWAAKLGR